MTTCQICGILSGKRGVVKAYEDDMCFAILKYKPAVPGHILLFPKKHYTIFEQVPDKEVTHLFKIANRLSTAIFESIGAQGSNIIISNGTAAKQKYPHFSINIIPRNENDGIDFQWQPKQLNEEEMSTIELSIKEALGEKEKPKEKKEKSEEIEGEDNYLMKSLRRIP